MPLIQQCSAADAIRAALLVITSARRHAVLSGVQTALCWQTHFATVVLLQQVCKIWRRLAAQISRAPLKASSWSIIVSDKHGCKRANYKLADCTLLWSANSNRQQGGSGIVLNAGVSSVDGKLVPLNHTDAAGSASALLGDSSAVCLASAASGCCCRGSLEGSVCDASIATSPGAGVACSTSAR
jgi:hypothetical protein